MKLKAAMFSKKYLIYLSLLATRFVIIVFRVEISESAQDNQTHQHSSGCNMACFMEQNVIFKSIQSILIDGESNTSA